ncbi:PREDICTED: WD repeat-containing and planar cell polarity effector protein fritz homolog isoform X3 [Amphimedon queenslandica]|uniref:Uncharacterized protein n=1 Tax=Amphimedon queenslandica TaxID=400682 RepID=A0AAN0J9A3_AMPQE|nr:PREDICTED: WD repeat-containing and planar cell polarity effector protein fritz homolog isoform X3 [Amphimedon queenslandica]|eukprot:XP_019853301.1 PREDICTED: WD repeat-containing and planar cell polarity effector protein fritz homolog isoform X3 [Amphimedon queenslandica]
MASILSHLHFWTLQPLSPSLSSAVGHNISVHSYQPKSTGASAKVDVESCRRYWSEGRGISWYLTNHKPMKLRDTLREVEEMLVSEKIVTVQWKTLRHLVILLDSGTIIVFTVAKHCGDIESIIIDRSIIQKLNGKINRALILSGSLVILYNDGSKVHYFSPCRRLSTTDSPTAITLSHDKLKKRIEKLGTIDLKAFELDVKGLPDHQIDRHMCTNPQQDLLVVWWCDLQDSGLRWSSMAAGEHTNMVLIKLKGNGKAEILTKLQTKCQPTAVFFSKTSGQTLYAFGQSLPDDESVAAASDGAKSFEYEVSLIDCSDRKNVRQSSSLYSIENTFCSEAQVKVCSPNNDESLLAAGCESGLIIMFDIKRDQVKKAKSYFLSISHISWHPAGAIVFVCGSRGEIQCLDCALNPLSFLLTSDVVTDISTTPLLQIGSHCLVPVQLEHAGWASVSREGEGHSGCYDNFAMVFSQGPIVLMRIELGVYSKGKLTVCELMMEYLRHKQLHQCVELILSLNWELSPQNCFNCLSLFMDHLLTLNPSTENEELMESALGSFFASGLSQSILNEYRAPVHLMARRFFFQLLRSSRFQKAFSLAVELSSRDLFMELHHTAQLHNETTLAELSLKKAEILANREKERRKKLSESSDSSKGALPKTLPSKYNPIITDNDRVILNPSVLAESPEKEGRIILESSTESDRGGEKRRGKLTSSTESSSSSSSKKTGAAGGAVPWTSAKGEAVNVINFGYF